MGLADSYSACLQKGSASRHVFDVPLHGTGYNPLHTPINQGYEAG